MLDRELTSQEAAAIVAAMAREALEDAALIEAAGLNDTEARWVLGNLNDAEVN